MQRLAGNRAVGRLAQRDPAARATVAVQRAPKGGGATKAATARARLQQRWGVRTIRPPRWPSRRPS